MTARRAATVLLLKDGAEGPEVFMVRRHRSGGFLPHAWVFPGGRVDEDDARVAPDRVTGLDGFANRMGQSTTDALGFGVAAVRETFEEAGVWLGSGSLPAEVRSDLWRGRCRMADLLVERDQSIDFGLLVPWSWWVTPKAESRRYDTRFIAAHVRSSEGRHDGRETVDSAWVSPRQVLAERSHEAFPLAPPTWWTLLQLAGFTSCEEALRASHQAHRRIQPVMRFDETLELLLPGHPDHDDDPIQGIADRITYAGGWIAWREGQRLPR